MDVELRYCVFYWSCQECCGSIGRHFLIFLIKISAIYTQIYIYREKRCFLLELLLDGCFNFFFFI